MLDRTPSLRLILTNLPPEDAPLLARELVARGEVACVNIIPGVRSFYIWEGHIEDAIESTLLIKTDVSHVDSVCHLIDRLHPHDVPEILVSAPQAVSTAYGTWVSEVVGSKPEQQ